MLRAAVAKGGVSNYRLDGQAEAKRHGNAASSDLAIRWVGDR